MESDKHVANQWSNWVQAISMLSLLVGMIFVFIELRQSNQIAAANAHLNLFLRQIETHNLVLNQESGIAEFQAKLRTTSYSDLSAVERERLVSMVASRFNLWVSVQRQHDQGLFPQRVVHDWQYEIEGFITEYPVAAHTLIEIYKGVPSVHQDEIFEPIRRYINHEAKDHVQ